MNTTQTYKQELNDNGFTIIDNIFSDTVLREIIEIITEADSSKATFRKSADLFAIRQFLKEIPEIGELVLTKKVKSTIQELFGAGYFAVKSIYFDKPKSSNWFVAYHQDLTISIKEKVTIEGYGPWTTKAEQYAVQPPLSVLENNFTIRIHLDDTNEHNGALRVIPGSHKKGVYRVETIDWTIEKEVTCPVPAGGIMIMRPLLLHASGRTTNGMRRRVIHLEFSNVALPAPLQWAEIN